MIQMTTFTSDAGATSATKDTTYKYGPYLVAVPTLKVGDGKGKSKVAALVAADVGWVYDKTIGKILANGGLTAKDDNDVLFKDY